MAAISILHDFKFKYARQIEGEVVIWSKISNGTVMGKTVLLKWFGEDGAEYAKFIEYDKGKKLLNNPNALLEFLEQENKVVIERIRRKGQFYFNGNLMNTAFKS